MVFTRVQVKDLNLLEIKKKNIKEKAVIIATKVFCIFGISSFATKVTLGIATTLHVSGNSYFQFTFTMVLQR